jgi:hypothetical protein
MEKDPYDPPPKELNKIPAGCGSLPEAPSSLDTDRAFLEAGERTAALSRRGWRPSIGDIDRAVA